MTDEYRPFKLDVEKYIRELPWSDTTYDHEKTLVAGNLRTLYALLEDEVRDLALALERWMVERQPEDFPGRLLLAELGKLHPEKWPSKEDCSCDDPDCDECPTRESLQFFIDKIMEEKERVLKAEDEYIRNLNR